MPDKAARQVAEINALLRALHQAGVQLDPGMAGGRAPALGHSSKAATEESLERGACKRLVSGWLAGGDPSRLLEAAYATAVHDETRRRRLTGRLAYPVLVAVLACGGLALMLHTVLPHVESAHDDLREPVTAGVAWLQATRNTMPAWLLGVPLLLLTGLYFGWRLHPLKLTPASPEIGSRARSRAAAVSDNVATLLEAGVEPSVAIGHARPPKRPQPLLGWARKAAPEENANAADFRAIARVYRTLAARGAERSARITPLLACVLIGGGATLTYGLALFVPVVELLWTLHE